MVREKYLENKIFSLSGKCVDGQGNLERTLKVREKSGNLKKKAMCKQSSEHLFCSRGERMYFLRDSLSPSPLIGGYS